MRHWRRALSPAQLPAPKLQTPARPSLQPNHQSCMLLLISMPDQAALIVSHHGQERFCGPTASTPGLIKKGCLRSATTQWHNRHAQHSC